MTNQKDPITLIQADIMNGRQRIDMLENQLTDLSKEVDRLRDAVENRVDNLVEQHSQLNRLLKKFMDINTAEPNEYEDCVKVRYEQLEDHLLTMLRTRWDTDRGGNSEHHNAYCRAMDLIGWFRDELLDNAKKQKRAIQPKPDRPEHLHDS